jgi:hypothetical protein
MLGSSDSRLLDLEQGEKSKGEGNVYEGLERAVKRIIMLCIPPLGESQGVYL